MLVVWGYETLVGSWGSVQEFLLIASQYGMSITLEYPQGYDLDSEVIKQVRENCENSSMEFEITNDMKSGYESADIVYSRNWMSPNAYIDGIFNKEGEIGKSMVHSEWI